MVEISYQSYIWIEEIASKDCKLRKLVRITKVIYRAMSGYQLFSLNSSREKSQFNRVILERLQIALNRNVRGNPAGLRKGRSCTDQSATLRIIVEQSLV